MGSSPVVGEGGGHWRLDGDGDGMGMRWGWGRGWLGIGKEGLSSLLVGVWLS